MLIELRRKNGMTQAALAQVLGAPQSYVSKYELGERRVDLIEMFEICHALETNPVGFLRKLIKTIESEGKASSASSGSAPHSRR
jgi:transcriptional regulator with XRE-family HTH domain